MPVRRSRADTKETNRWAITLCEVVHTSLLIRPLTSGITINERWQEAMMPAEETTAARFSRLAQECLDIAATFVDRDQRDALLEMAQVWQRLADQYANATRLVFQPGAGE